MNYGRGWYGVGFTRDFTKAVTPVDFGPRRLMAVRDEATDGLHIFDAVCPHRGAHLAQGRCEGDTVVCPFHGIRVRLGASGESRYEVREYPSACVGPMVLVRVGDGDAPDLPAALQALEADHLFYVGFTLLAETTIEMVVENGFDSAHFPAVHGVMEEPALEVSHGPSGELVARGEFRIPGSRWGSSPDGFTLAAYTARAFSPGTVIAELRGEGAFNYAILTTAVPAREPRRCRIHLAVALPRSGAMAASPGFARALLEVTRDGLEKDIAIWNAMDPDVAPVWRAEDAAPIQFARFWRSFRA